MAKYKYEYQCPSCGTQLELKMRVTQTKRKCPHCGTPITPEEIDSQKAVQEEQQTESLTTCFGCAMSGCLIPFGLILCLTGIGAIVGIPLIVVSLLALAFLVSRPGGPVGNSPDREVGERD